MSKNLKNDDYLIEQRKLTLE
jgi:hypothetical protein